MLVNVRACPQLRPLQISMLTKQTRIRERTDRNLEGSVRSHRKHGRWRECDLTEAGLNEAADGWALWG
jgi:hypothetical protein